MVLPKYHLLYILGKVLHKYLSSSGFWSYRLDFEASALKEFGSRTIEVRVRMISCRNLQKHSFVCGFLIYLDECGKVR